MSACCHHYNSLTPFNRDGASECSVRYSRSSRHEHGYSLRSIRLKCCFRYRWPSHSIIVQRWRTLFVVDGMVLRWFALFLTERTQALAFPGLMSVYTLLHFGVLRPLPMVRLPRSTVFPSICMSTTHSSIPAAVLPIRIQGSYYFAKFIFSDFSLTFPDKMNNFPWLISLFATPVKQY